MQLATSMVFAAPSVIASGQLYIPEDGANRNSFATWYRRLQQITQSDTVIT